MALALLQLLPMNKFQLLECAHILREAHCNLKIELLTMSRNANAMQMLRTKSKQHFGCI